MAGVTIISVPRIQIAGSAQINAGDLSSPGQWAPDVGIGGVGFIPTIGTAPGQSNGLYCEQLAVTSGTPFVLDVSTGLLDPAGNAIAAWLRVQAIFIENLSTTTGQILTLQGGPSNPLFSDVYTVQPNIESMAQPTAGTYQPYPGFAVSGSTKTIKVTAAAGTNVPFNLFMLGCSV